MATESAEPRIESFFPAVTSSARETMEIGAALARRLPSGTVVALQGNLGSGKTHLVKGAADALGVPPSQVTSPTFTLLHEYQGDELPIYHFDAYRVEHPEEFYELGYEEYVFGRGICFIEWPERVAPLIPDEALILRLTHTGRNTRRIELLHSGDE